MPNFDFIWGLDQFLIELGIIELWHLIIVHVFLFAILFVANVVIISPLIRLFNKKWLLAFRIFTNGVFGFIIIWPIVFGVLWLLLGSELSLARHLYVYFALFVMFLASQIHIDIAVPNYHGESDGGKIEERARSIHH